MINERLMSQGSFEVKFGIEALHLYTTINKFGSILITPQWVDPRLYDDATMMSIARYHGIVFDKDINNGVLTVKGAGPTAWLGSDELGEGIETKVSLSSSTLENALDNLLPAAVIKGTITEPAGTTYTGEHQFQHPLEAIRTTVASMGCEYRVNNDGTIDAGPNNDVFNVDDADVSVVVVPKGFSGADPTYTGVEVERMKSKLSARKYATRAIVVTEDSNNVETLVGAQDRTPSPTETDWHGNTIVRTLILRTSGTPVEVSTYLTTQMNEHSVVQEQEISTEFYEIANGDMRLGDAFWCFDPPAFEDTDNEITFRGLTFNPVKLRLIAASWPVTRGMGVYYRTPEASPTYTDVTNWVEFESQAQRVGTRR